MGNTVAKITEKIVKITGNEATREFIGKIVTRKSTEHGIVYAIGSTGYILSTAEYKYFAEAGAIAQATILPKRKSASKVSASAKSTKAAKGASKANAGVSADIAEKRQALRAERMSERLEDTEERISNSTPLASAAKAKRAVDAIVDDETDDIIEVSQPEKFEFGSKEHHALLETSDFLMNYPSPSFEMNTPKRLSFFDKKDDLKEMASNWFDKLGRKGRDKLVNAMSE